MKKQPNDYNTERKPTWCPGCGNFGIWAALKNVFAQKGWEPHQFAIVYGIGCGGNMPDFVKSYGLHSLHGRTIPVAEGIKLANHDLPVICIAGDGDAYGEGGNHLIHACRANHDITMLVHDNRIYGLTAGQVSPTSAHGFQTKSTPQGVIEYPVRALALAISQGATFVAQGFAGDLPHLRSLITKAIDHKGFSLLNILQPCVTWNKVDTFEFYRQNTYKLEESGYEPHDKLKAIEKSLETEKLPLGVLYEEKRPVYHEQEVSLQSGPLVKRKPNLSVIKKLMHDFR